MNNLPRIVEPVTLAGEHARLEPLAPEHEAGLVDAVLDGALWQLWYTTIPSPQRMGAEIQRRLRAQAAGSMLPFTVFDAAGRITGMTSYMNIDSLHQRVEIGATWTRASAQRTPLNTQCKRLLLAHAFERLQCIAVEFRTHRFNQQSRRAIERLGAQLDGVLRNHQRAGDGTLRDTAVYSITADEWPTVRAHLDYKLQNRTFAA